MFRFAMLMAAVVALFALPGCGQPPYVAVKGKVLFDGKPLKGCKVMFFPDVSEFNPDRHGSGFGITNEAGEFEVSSPNGTKGMWPGKYKVMFEAWVDNKGNPVPPDKKPSEVPGGVKNILPPKYESRADTPESATISSSGGEFTFQLTK